MEQGTRIDSMPGGGGVSARLFKISTVYSFTMKYADQRVRTRRTFTSEVAIFLHKVGTSGSDFPGDRDFLVQIMYIGPWTFWHFACFSTY